MKILFLFGLCLATVLATSTPSDRLIRWVLFVDWNLICMAFVVFVVFPEPFFHIIVVVSFQFELVPLRCLFFVFVLLRLCHTNALNIIGFSCKRIDCIEKSNNWCIKRWWYGFEFERDFCLFAIHKWRGRILENSNRMHCYSSCTDFSSPHFNHLSFFSYTIYLHVNELPLYYNFNNHINLWALNLHCDKIEKVAIC